jgi:hypothetical protein
MRIVGNRSHEKAGSVSPRLLVFCSLGPRFHGPLVSCSETLERGRTGTSLGRGIEVGDCVQPPLARLPGAEPCAEYRHQDALISRALEAVKGGPSSLQ